ncbi:MAG: sulfatase-like hydrolase/transferase [Acidobacteriota bacterium]
MSRRKTASRTAAVPPPRQPTPESHAGAKPPARKPAAILAIVAAFGLLAAAGGWWFLGRGSVPHNGPIVLISIDTLRADHLPIYGYDKVMTPAVDALAADGIVFDHAWAHAPQTLPSHASILTGQLPFEHGVRDNMGFALEPGAVTLPRLLRDRGFATGGFVSAYVMRAATGLNQGFDAYDDRLPPSSPEIAIGDVQRDGGQTLAAAEQWLNGRTSSRYFLFVHLYEPHTPYTPPERFRHVLPYDGEVAYSDELVGRLIESLKRRGQYDDALVVFLSDHGEGLGDHGEMEHGIFLYGETIRVPLVVKLPGQRGKRRRVADPVQHIDLLPTILDLAGIPTPNGLQGRTLGPAFGGQRLDERGLYAEALYSRYHYGWSELYALTDSRYRFIRAPRDELYDIQLDPGETVNLAAERESARVAMRKALDSLLRGVTIDTPAEVSAEDRERLRALGYVGMQATAKEASRADALPDPKDHIQTLARYRDALALVRSNRVEEAIPLLQGIVADSPAMADVWSEIAGLRLRQGRLDDALAAYRRLVEVAPHDPAGLVSVTQVLVDLGRLDEARQQADAALAVLPPTDHRWRASAHRLLMRIALARNDESEARAEAKRAEEADPEMPLTDYVEGLICHRAGRFVQALPHFEATLRKSQNRTFQMPDVRYHLADTLARLDRLGEAEGLFRDELRYFPASARSRAGLAMLYRAQGRSRLAETEIEEMLRVTPNPESFGLAERLWTMFGEHAKAAGIRARARQAGR